ncbi:transcriptional regulator [Pseudomonas syringae CC1557]|uniref:Transcriptional regulator n=1 Tax=Pseudomonas syringae CC1557 TaxID=1357279 RepID=W0MW04_PSESX|nr:transcriptional regulator [Pseudomonas syringae CC1557]
MDAALAVIVEKWIRLILYHLAKDIHRYGTLKRAIRGVSGNVLIQQLKERERNEIIARMPSSKFHAQASPAALGIRDVFTSVSE